MLVTDTHPLVWYATENYNKLSRKVRTAFQDAEAGRSIIIIPAVVLWEISLVLKADPEEFELECSFDEFVKNMFRVSTFVEEPISCEIVARSHVLNFHTDPFDTIIVATALVKDMPLITNDGEIHKREPCELYWD